MELQQLERFLLIAENDSISRASSVLGIGQPALSRQIKELEDEIGTQLFYRHGRGIRLTEAGKTFRSTISPLIKKLAKSDCSGAAVYPACFRVEACPVAMRPLWPLALM
jgi:LysR family transcriptional regulator, nitrogen assimilation regulatory protein